MTQDEHEKPDKPRTALSQVTTNMGTEEIVAAVQQRRDCVHQEILQIVYKLYHSDFQLVTEDNGRATVADKARFLAFHLVGAAKTLYHDLPPADKAQFSVIKAKLFEQFSPSTIDLQMAKMAFCNCKQGPYESLSRLYHKCTEADPSFGHGPGGSGCSHHKQQLSSSQETAAST